MDIENVKPTIENKYLTLNNGYEMPKFGLGTFMSEKTEENVYCAIKAGVRLIDTASRYNNEKQVGDGIARAINEGIVKREELFVVTKLWCGDKEQVVDAIKRQLQDLNLTYVDLYLDHWPMQIFEWEGKSYKVPTHKLWKSLEECVTLGYTRAIGLSNYCVQTIMDILSYCEIKPSVLQIEYNPYLIQSNLVKFCKDNGLQVMVYNSLCKNKYVEKFHKDENINLLDEPVILEIARNHDKTPGQIALNWALAQDLIVIPMSSNPKRIEENIQSLDFRITDEEIEQINKLNRKARCNQSTQWGFFNNIDLFA